MTSDGLFVLVNGMVLTRDEVLASLEGAPAWSSFEITGARLVDVGDDAASLVYYSTSSRPGERPFVALMSSTYRRTDGRLRLALYQQTPIPAD